MHVHFEQALETHADVLCPKIRQQDCDEVYALTLGKPGPALKQSIALSDWAVTGFVDGEPVAMLGVAPINIIAKIGMPWMLTTDAAEQHLRRFMLESVYWRDSMLASYPRLRNVVDQRNTVSRRWLSWLGFAIRPAEPVGPLKLPFSVFEMGIADVCGSRANRSIDNRRRRGLDTARPGSGSICELQRADHHDECRAGETA